jgi:hypothetical protein
MSTNLCASVGGNTGAVACDISRGVPRKILVGGKQFSSVEYASADSLQTAILAAINLSNGDTNKLFPFTLVEEVAVNTEADTTGSLALGPNKRLRKGRPAYTYTSDMSWSQFQHLLPFDNKVVPVFTFDDGSAFWGRRNVAAANTPNTNPFGGELARVTISGGGFKDGANAATGAVTISVSYLDVDDFEKRGTYALLPNLAPGDLNGLIDVMLSEPTAHTTNAYKIAITIPLPIANTTEGDRNIFTEYGAILAALTWTAGTGANYATALTITSVAVDNTLKCLTVTFDSTAYTALANGAKIKLTPPNVPALVVGNMVGYEIGTIILTKS